MSKDQGVFSQQGSELLNAVAAMVQAEAERLLRIRGLLKGLPELPADLGRVVANQLAEEWGGQHVYVPMDKQRRDARIYELFTGANHHDLAKRFKLGVPTIYKIIDQERARRRAPQLRLPMSS